MNSLVKEVFSIAHYPERGGSFKEVWWTCHHLPVFDANGEICGMLQKAEDVTAEVQAEKMHELISSEFTHQIKNISCGDKLHRPVIGEVIVVYTSLCR